MLTPLFFFEAALIFVTYSHLSADTNWKVFQVIVHFFNRGLSKTPRNLHFVLLTGVARTLLLDQPTIRALARET